MRSSNFLRTVFAVAAAVILLSSFAQPEVRGDTIDLADIVGGGDGSGNGSNAGINMETGDATTDHQGLLSGFPENQFVTSSNPFVDGVFIPDGGVGGSEIIQVSSTGLTVDGISDSTGFIFDDSIHSWDHIWNGNNLSTSTTLEGPRIGVHANKGITFDLDAIESAAGEALASYTITAATANSGVAAPDFYLFIDGVLQHSVSLSGADQTMVFTGSLESSDRFLTLVCSSNGRINSQWANWINPTITTCLLGDVDLNGVVNFQDIAPFIARLSSGDFQTEADCDQNGTVNFFDIAPFIEILSGM